MADTQKSSSVFTVTYKDLTPPSTSENDLSKSPYALTKALNVFQNQIESLMTQVATLSRSQNGGTQQVNSFLSSIATANYTITGAFVTIPGMTFSLTKPGWWMISMDVEVASDTLDPSITFQLLCDGNPQVGNIVVGTGAVGTVVLFASKRWFFQSMTGREAIAAQVMKPGGAGASAVNGTDSALSAVWLSP